MFVLLSARNLGSVASTSLTPRSFKSTYVVQLTRSSCLRKRKLHHHVQDVIFCRTSKKEIAKLKNRPFVTDEDWSVFICTGMRNELFMTKSKTGDTRVVGKETDPHLF